MAMWMGTGIVDRDGDSPGERLTVHLVVVDEIHVLQHAQDGLQRGQGGWRRVTVPSKVPLPLLSRKMLRGAATSLHPNTSAPQDLTEARQRMVAVESCPHGPHHGGVILRQ